MFSVANLLRYNLFLRFRRKPGYEHKKQTYYKQNGTRGSIRYIAFSTKYFCGPTR